MKFSSIKYYFDSAIEAIVKNRVMSLASIITVASCVFIFMISFWLGENIDYFLLQLQSDVKFSVYLKDETSQDEIKSIENELNNIEHIKRVEFWTKEDALAEARETIIKEEYAAILDGLEEDNPLPMSFEVYIDNIENQQSVLNQVEVIKVNRSSIENISSTDASSFISINRGVKITSLVVIGFMAVICVVIIMNTIKIAVNTRKREIGIMKYVGATDWFIRWPFIIEGVLIGFLGALIPTLIGYFSYGELISIITSKLPILNTIVEFKTVESIFKTFVPISLTLGISLGFIGSFSSIRKYLKV